MQALCSLGSYIAINYKTPTEARADVFDFIEPFHEQRKKA
jgi:hypothetical protein